VLRSLVDQTHAKLPIQRFKKKHGPSKLYHFIKYYKLTETNDAKRVKLTCQFISLKYSQEGFLAKPPPPQELQENHVVSCSLPASVIPAFYIL
jgi:hypothetical protein